MKYSFFFAGVELNEEPEKLVNELNILKNDVYNGYHKSPDLIEAKVKGFKYLEMPSQKLKSISVKEFLTKKINIIGLPVYKKYKMLINPNGTYYPQFILVDSSKPYKSDSSNYPGDYIMTFIDDIILNDTQGTNSYIVEIKDNYYTNYTIKYDFMEDKIGIYKHNELIAGSDIGKPISEIRCDWCKYDEEIYDNFKQIAYHVFNCHKAPNVTKHINSQLLNDRQIESIFVAHFGGSPIYNPEIYTAVLKIIFAMMKFKNVFLKDIIPNLVYSINAEYNENTEYINRKIQDCTRKNLNSKDIFKDITVVTPNALAEHFCNMIHNTSDFNNLVFESYDDNTGDKNFADLNEKIKNNKYNRITLSSEEIELINKLNIFSPEEIDSWINSYHDTNDYSIQDKLIELCYNEVKNIINNSIV